VSRYDSDEGFVTIPKVRVFIDDIILDEELQLERELMDEEYKPVQAAWDACEPEDLGLMPLPLQEFKARPHWHLNSRQVEFLRHLFFIGEIGYSALIISVHHLEFKTALELFREEWGDYDPQKVREAANLLWELRAVA
jgi:hypothetical protein